VPADRARSGQEIVVVGASAGGLDALGEVVAKLPADIVAAIEPGHVRVVRGPKENGYRPAIDPLFRSAAHSFGPRVVGVILSGVLDDGTAGLAVIKMRGGRTVVQDPEHALYPGMPASAIEFVDPDVVLPAGELGDAIAHFAQEPVTEEVPEMPAGQMLDEEEFIQIDRGSSDRPQNGTPSGFTCPECGGDLWESDEGGLPRYRGRTGHDFSIETLLAEQSDNVEAGMWAALRETRGARCPDAADGRALPCTRPPHDGRAVRAPGEWGRGAGDRQDRGSADAGAARHRARRRLHARRRVSNL